MHLEMIDEGQVLSQTHLKHVLWENRNNSPTWIKATDLLFGRPFGYDFRKINYDSSEGEHWGRSEVVRIDPDFPFASMIFRAELGHPAVHSAEMIQHVSLTQVVESQHGLMLIVRMTVIW